MTLDIEKGEIGLLMVGWIPPQEPLGSHFAIQ